MQRRKFLRSSFAVTAGAALTGKHALAGAHYPPQKEIYELREYEMHFGTDKAQLENYFKNALIPALNKYGVKTVGVFNEWRPTDPARLYLLAPYSSPDHYLSVHTKLKTDADYLKNSAAYNSIPADKPVYNRFTSSLMLAFDGFPKIVLPSGKTRMFELRTYEGYSEDAVKRKIKMFNEGEFPIFNETTLSPVFFGEVFAGDKMPRLTYMITCSSMEERDKGWAAFGADPRWKKLVADPQYANSTSKITNVFLSPTSYSQV